MGTPDLLGTYGTFSFYTSDPFAMDGPVAGGTIYPVEVRDGVVRGTLEGPDNPLLKRPEKVRADFVAHIDPSHTYAKIVDRGRGAAAARGRVERLGARAVRARLGSRSMPNAGST